MANRVRRAEPTKVIGIRFPQHMLPFMTHFEPEMRNPNILRIIKNSPEYQAFEAKKQQEQYNNQPSIFDNLS